MGTHKFGGDHTRIKLEIVRLYAEFYTKVLKFQPFNLVYIDPFAGTGECEIKTGAESVSPKHIDLIENVPYESVNPATETIDGSVKIALQIDRLFNQYHFINNNRNHYKQLKELKVLHPEKNIELHKGDANEQTVKILRSINWSRTRALMFIDPYGMNTDWETLEKIAATGAIDLWYLFPLSGVYRQAAGDYSNISPEKAAAIDRMLGTKDWRTTFYESTGQQDMFGDEAPIVRTVGVRDIVRFAKERLQTIFPLVLDPRLLPDKGPLHFALFFAAANPRAASLCQRVAEHIIKKMSLR